MDDENVDTTQTNRRVLLKGAVAVGAGVVAYTAPVILPVPSYAAHGLTTNQKQSGLICIGFSPNHLSNEGDWHIPGDVANVFDLIYPATNTHAVAAVGAIATQTTPIRFNVRVPAGAGGTWHEVRVGGHFNNWDGGTGGNYGTTGWNGGGIKIQVVDSNCDILIQNWLETTSPQAADCTLNQTSFTMKPSNSPINGTDPGTTATSGSYSFSGTKYFHSGQPRKGGNWVGGFRFRVRCWDVA